MARNLKTEIEITADTKSARSEIGRLEQAFSSSMQELGKSKQEIAEFRKLGRNAEENAAAIDKLDAATKKLVLEYSKASRSAADKDFLGLKSHSKLQSEIDRTRAAYERLRKSGTLSQRELAQASAVAEQRIKSLNAQMTAGTTGGFVAGLSKARYGILAVGAALGGTVATMRRWLDEADKIAKTADKIGIATEALQALRFAGGLTGQTIEQTDKSLEQFTRRLGDAANGTGPLAKELAKLGISVTDANGGIRKTEDVLNDYADAIQNAISPQERLRLAVAAFGKDGAGMVNALRNGGRGLTELKKEAGIAGGVLEDRLLRVAERLNDNFARLTTKVGGGLKRAFLEVADFAGLAGGMSQLEQRTAELRNTLEASEKQAAVLRAEIERLQAIDDSSLTPAIEQLQQSLARAEAQSKSLGEEISGIGSSAATEGGTAVKGINALREALQSAKDQTKGLYTETQKLFAQPEYDPFANIPGQAAKAVAAWQLVGEAVSAVRRGSDDADQAVEKAAGALNKLQESGAATDYELGQMKQTLAEALNQVATSDPQPIKITVDKDGLFSATDQATEEAMARAKTLIIKADLDTSAAEAKIEALRAKAASILNASGGGTLDRDARARGE